VGPVITFHLLGNNQRQGINVNADGLDLGTTGQIDLLDHLTQLVINACHLVKVEAASLVLSKAVTPSAPRPPTRTSAFTAFSGLMISIFSSIHTAFFVFAAARQVTPTLPLEFQPVCRDFIPFSQTET